MKLRLKNIKKLKAQTILLLKLIKKNTNPTLITTERQTSGRGRMGKKWEFREKEIYLFLFSLNMIKKKSILNNLPY